jgi:hypothetical protein
LVHVPTVPGRLQALQVAVQALAQQTPCEQCAEAQSLSPAQTWPSFFLQMLPTQE